MFTVFDIVLAVFRSPIKFLFWFLFFFAFVVLAYLAVPRQYGSDGKLFVQVGRSSVGAAPTTSAGKVSLQDSRETEVKSVVGLLESRELADRVIDIVGVDKILEPHSAIGRWIEDLPKFDFGDTKIASDETELSNEEIEAINRRNEAIEELMNAIEIGHQKNTTVVSVGVKSQTPFLAQQIAQAYLDEYQKAHVKVNTPQSGGFFTKQLAMRQEELTKREKELADFRSGLDVLDLGGARSLLQREIDQLKLDALNTEVRFSEAKEKYSKIKRDFLNVPKFIVGADKSTSSLARDKAREALYSLQLEEAELSAMYRGSNPKLVAIRDAISKAKRQLSRIPQTYKEAEKSINPARKEILVMMTQASAEMSGFQKRLETTKQLMQAKLKEIENLNTLTIKESQLTRRVDICRKTMLGVADKSAESVILDALDSERISNVTIAQAASLVPKKIFPSGLAFAALGAVLSGLLATIMTFLKEFRLGYQLDRRNRQLAVANLQTEAAPTRRRVVREAALAGAGVGGGVTQTHGQQYDYRDDFTTDDEDESYRLTGERALHEELQEGSRDDSSLDETRERQRAETWKRRSEKQVSVWMLIGGFVVVIAAYFLMAAFR